MKNIIVSLSFLSMVLISVGCTKENIRSESASNNKIKVTFIASDSKSFLNADKSVSWQSADQIGIYDETDCNDFKTNDGSPSFSGSITAGSTKFYAIYPDVRDKRAASASYPYKGPAKFEKTTTTGGEIVVCHTYLQTCQNAVPGTFSQFACMSACIPTLNGDKLSGEMINLCSFFKFTISTDRITRVMFTSANGTKLSGLVHVSFDEGNISTEGDEVPYVECKPTTSDRYTFEPATYYVCVLPGSYGKIQLSFADSDGKIYETSTKSDLSCKRNEVLNFGTIDSNLPSTVTDKLSLLYNFSCSNCSGYAEASGAGDKNVILNAGGKDYTAVFNDVYKGSAKNEYLMFYKSGYMKTPAVPGYALDKVILSFIGHTNNFAGSFRIFSEDGTKEYSGGYYSVKTPTWEKPENKYAFGTVGPNKPMYYAHMLSFGENGIAEKKSTVLVTGDAEDKTSYMVKNFNKTYISLISSAEFIYKKL